MKTICDPPSGWLFGFPKEIPSMDMPEGEFFEWLISNGYPAHLIPKEGEYFPCRFWHEE